MIRFLAHAKLLEVDKTSRRFTGQKTRETSFTVILQTLLTRLERQKTTTWSLLVGGGDPGLSFIQGCCMEKGNKTLR